MFSERVALATSCWILPFASGAVEVTGRIDQRMLLWMCPKFLGAPEICCSHYQQSGSKWRTQRPPAFSRSSSNSRCASAIFSSRMACDQRGILGPCCPCLDPKSACKSARAFCMASSLEVSESSLTTRSLGNEPLAATATSATMTNGGKQGLGCSSKSILACRPAATTSRIPQIRHKSRGFKAGVHHASPACLETASSASRATHQSCRSPSVQKRGVQSWKKIGLKWWPLTFERGFRALNSWLKTSEAEISLPTTCLNFLC